MVDISVSVTTTGEGMPRCVGHVRRIRNIFYETHSAGILAYCINAFIFLCPADVLTVANSHKQSLTTLN